MKFQCNNFSNKISKRGKWHSWFAWYPVMLDSGVCCWMERIERRADYQYNFGLDIFSCWEWHHK